MNPAVSVLGQSLQFQCCYIFSVSVLGQSSQCQCLDKDHRGSVIAELALRASADHSVTVSVDHDITVSQRSQCQWIFQDYYIEILGGQMVVSKEPFPGSMCANGRELNNSSVLCL